MEVNKIYHGDCLDVMKEFPENSIDAIICDPPYGLSFMGKKWDYDVPSEEIWRQCLRVLKPGGYLLSFAGTRTQHRMAVRIEDAGFEIRDMIAWVYSTGFPKSLNVFKQLKKQCECGNMEAYENNRNERCISVQSQTEHDLRPLSEPDLSQTVNPQEEQGEVLQSGLSEQSTYNEGAETVAVFQFSEGGEQSSVERGADIQKTKRKLQRGDLSEVSGGVSADGEKGRICDATSSSDGTTPEKIIGEGGGSTPQRPQSEQQQDREPCAFCKQYFTQAVGTFGIGTALKPALEPITVARKPIEGTVAENCLKWGVGGINIDGCRVETSDNLNGGSYSGGERSDGDWKDNSGFKNNKLEAFEQPQGRFPANLLHDGSDEVVGLFPHTKVGARKSGQLRHTKEGDLNFTGDTYTVNDFPANEGSASRFFYCAKASKAERNRGLENFEEVRSSDRQMTDGVGGDNPRNRTNTPKQNFHPTVKPIALMEYLIKLVSKEGHTILDPFAGSGSTLIAAKKLKREFIGIELDPEYIKIAEARLASVDTTLF